MKKYRIIIPSFSELSTEMQVETGEKLPAFIKLGGKPLYSHIISSYEEIKNEAEFFLILPDSQYKVDLNYVGEVDLKVLNISNSRNIADTVRYGLLDIEKNQAIFIHMGDTIVSDKNTLNSDTIYVQERTDLYKWTSIKEVNGRVKILSDRNQPNPQKILSQLVCVGIFSFSDGLTLKKHILHTLNLSKKSHQDPFFCAVEDYSKEKRLQLSKVKNWNDCGHIDSYYSSRINYFNLRHFNTLTYDSNNGLVTKKSLKVNHFRSQVRWYKQVPDDFAPFLPRIFKSDDGENPHITMELLSIPSLSDLYVSATMGLGNWNDVVNKILSILTLFSQHQFESPLAKFIAEEVYINKTRDRIYDYLLKSPELTNAYIEYENSQVNLNYVLHNLKNYAENNSLLNIKKLVPIHGDMCFSNLMYDKRQKNIKLIDPRGEFGIPGIFGDQRYDLAKLMHSYDGKYDLIISDNFKASVTKSNKLRCEIAVTDYHKKVTTIFNSRLIHDSNLKKQCDAIQGLLFLGMLPLHSDKPQRQLAMLHTGLNIFARNMI